MLFFFLDHILKGTRENVRLFEKDVRAQLSSCTRNAGCWGPANHHFQSISVIGEQEMDRGTSHFAAGKFREIETETVMHIAHVFADVGLKDFFFNCLPELNRKWEIPANVGAPDPYLVPRGGTSRKCSNKRIIK